MVFNFYRYLIAILTTLLAVWVRTLLSPSLGVECPFSLFYLSVLLTAWLGGTGPAVFAMLLGALAAAHFFILPEGTLWIQELPDMVQLTIFILVNCVATLLFYRVQKQRSLAEKKSQENQSLTDSLREADNKKDEFLALLAHELRNPMAHLRSCAKLLEEGSTSPARIASICEVLHRQVNHLVRITDDLLDVARFNQGKMILKKSYFDLRSAVEDSAEILASVFHQKQQRLRVILPPKAVTVYGDPVRIVQLVCNLLENASKYTSAGGRISVLLEVSANQANLIVDDNGIGFAPTHANLIMEPFTQIDRSRTREYGGLGVGLTIVKKLVSLHSGELLAESRGPGQGSRFTVSFPLAETTLDTRDISLPPNLVTTSAASDGAPARPKPFTHYSDSGVYSPVAIRPQSDSCDTNSARILLVDDNQDAANLLAELLQADGYEADVAYDGFEALEKHLQKPYDVLIVDIGLPGLDGHQFALRLGQQAARPSLLIALSGWGSEADKQKSRDVGFDHHLVKPVRYEELLNLLPLVPAA